MKNILVQRYSYEINVEVYLLEHKFIKFSTLYSFQFKIKLIRNIKYKPMCQIEGWAEYGMRSMNESLRNELHYGRDRTSQLPTV